MKLWVMCVLLLSGQLAAQSMATDPSGKARAFDVVSIRENKSGGVVKTPEYGPTADGYHVKNLPIFVVMLSAFAPVEGGAAFFNPSQILNMPDWMLRDRYDIDARIGEKDLAAWQTSAGQPEMLHALLEQMLTERFKFKAHREMKEMPVYELTVSKSGLKAGVKLSATADMSAVKSAHALTQLPGGGAVSAGSNPGEYIFYNATMASMGVMLQSLAGRPIQNNTGLPGRYDFTLQVEWGSNGVGQVDTESLLVSALDEQLGLKLQAAKGQVETLVIDHVEKPSEN